MTKLEKEIEALYLQLDKLNARQAKIDDRKKIKYTGWFVKKIVKKGKMVLTPTQKGLNELKKYNIRLLEDTGENKYGFENPGISYTPDECFCMICHSKKTTGYLTSGFTLRFAVCLKHTDFLYMFYRLEKIV